MKLIHDFARQLCGIVVLMLVAGPITGCATTAGPIHVSPLPSSDSQAVTVNPVSVSQVSGRSISNELNQMQNLMAETSPGIARAREHILHVHNFSAGTSLRRIFLENNLFARFDPNILGYSRIKAPIFFATAGDVIDYLQNVLNYYVRVEGTGTFVISRCTERVYSAPPEAESFFTQSRLMMLESAVNAHITYMPTGVLYVYDNHTGQRQVRAYLKSIQNLKKTEQAWEHLKPVQLNQQTLNAVTSLQEEVNTLRAQIRTLRSGGASDLSDDSDSQDMGSASGLADNSGSQNIESAAYLTSRHHANIRSAVATSSDPPSLSGGDGGSYGDNSFSRDGTYRIYLASTTFPRDANAIKRLANSKMNVPAHILHDRKLDWYSVYCTADSLGQAQKICAEAEKLGYRAYYVRENGDKTVRRVSQTPTPSAAPAHHVLSSHHSVKPQKKEKVVLAKPVSPPPPPPPPVAPPPPPEPTWTLHRGLLIGDELNAWAKKAGWTVVWQLSEDWSVPSTTYLNGNFKTAVTKVITALSSNGADIHAVFHTNNTVVISGTGN